MKGKSVRGILSVLLALVIVFGPLPMGTPTSFADGVVIDIGTVSEGGTGYTYAGNKVTITTDGSYTLTGTTTTNKVIVASGVVANITLDAVSIDVSKESYSCAFALDGTARTIITLAGDNVLTSGQGCAGLRVPVYAQVTIGGSGSLQATGGWNPNVIHLLGAGIGGDQGHKDSGAIEITGGTIIANGGACAAGIGSCQSTNAAGDFSSIVISGGNVTAHGGVEAAGIGGVKDGKGGTILISGGAIVSASTNDISWQCPDIGSQAGQPSMLMVDGNAVLNLLKKGLHVTTFAPGSCTIQGPAAGSYLGVYVDGIKQPTHIDMSTVNNGGLGYLYTDDPTKGCRVTLTTNDNYYITGSTTDTSLEVDYRVQNVNITLENATIDVASCNDGKNALTLIGSTTANLTLMGTNTLKGARSGAALAVPENATVTIDGCGTLNAIGGVHSAGIGASRTVYANAGTIIITSGTINAQGGEGAAGIGGGCSGGMSGVSDWACGGQVTITGGHVTAAGGQGSSWAGGKDPAAIGGGTNGFDFQGSGGTLLVDGGATVTLNSGGTNASCDFVTCTIEGTGAGDLAGHYENGVRTGSITLISIAYPADITGVAHGAAKTATALGLPATVRVQTSAGAATAPVTWDVDACSYNPAITTEQTFIVSGTVILPTGVTNPNNVDLTTGITVTVNAQAVAPNPAITSIAAVDNVEVAYGTAEAAAIAALATTTTITDSNNDTHIVNLSWSIASYDGNTAGNYTATGTFALPTGIDQSDPEIELKVTATVTVNAEASTDKTLESITAPSAITGVANGVAKTADALGLPSKVTLTTDQGNVQAAVSWDVTNCSYDPAVTSAQTFTVSGIVILPTGVANPNNVDLTTGITVTVKAQAVAPDPTITSIAAVNNVEVAYGTAEAAAIAALATTTTITDSNNDTHIVNLSWSIASYDGNTAGNYTATGTFALPTGIDQSDPEIELKVTATVTVNAAVPAPTYPLTIAAATGGSIISGSSGNYAAGTVIAIAATPDSGYSFSKWTAIGGGTFANANRSSTTYIMPANSVKITARFIYQGSGGGIPGGDTGDSGTGGGDTGDGGTSGSGSGSTDEGSGSGSTGDGDTVPTIDATLTAGTYEKTLAVSINAADGSVLINLGTGIANEAFDMAIADNNGKKTIFLAASEVPGANSYVLQLPISLLASDNSSRHIEMATEIGVIALPSNMLEGMQLAGIGDVSISIGRGDKSALPDAVKAAIGDRSLVQLALWLDGVATEWNNPDAPVMVSIPYEPTAAELKAPEYIVVWHIDGSGNVVSVPNGRYDSATGTVTFTTTHFSHYAIAYEHKTFTDLGSMTWAKPSIEVLASKGILRGVPESQYFPKNNITRADFLCFLVRTLGIDTRFDGNFDDIDKEAYYYREIGVAKKLGITYGTGNNKFSPDASITRQDMMVLTINALKMLKKLQQQGAASDLQKFTDRSLIATYAKPYVATAVKEGLIVGSQGQVNPWGNTTRAEAAVFLYRVYKKY